MIGPHTDSRTGHRRHPEPSRTTNSTIDTRPDNTDKPEIFRPPSYVLTRGRTTSSIALELTALVRATGRYHPADVRAIHRRPLELCREPVAVAEVASALGRPVTVVKILLADLVEIGALNAKAPPPPSAFSNDPDILEAVLDGLRNLT